LQTNKTSKAIGCAESEERQRRSDLEEAIRQRIEKDRRYAFYFSEVSCECSTGVLTVRGRVPTDRLKNVLWSLIGDLDGLAEIDDQLDVISSTGPSSIHAR
jgi:hypothetical protein